MPTVPIQERLWRKVLKNATATPAEQLEAAKQLDRAERRRAKVRAAKAAEPAPAPPDDKGAPFTLEPLSNETVQAALKAATAQLVPPPPPAAPVPCAIAGCPDLASASHNDQRVCGRHLLCLNNGTSTNQSAATEAANAGKRHSQAVLRLTDEDIRALAARSGDHDPHTPGWYRAAGLHRAGGDRPFKLPDQAAVQTMLSARLIQTEGQKFATSVPGEPNLPVGSSFSETDGHRTELSPTARAEQIAAYKEALANSTLSDADIHELVNEPVVSRLWNEAEATVAERKSNVNTDQF